MGIISRYAVEEYINKSRQDFSWVKSLTKKELFHEIRCIAPDYQFKTKPRSHQLACTLVGICVPGFLFFLDMGAGKTKIMLDVFCIRRMLGEADKGLAIADTVINAENWRQEIEIHTDLEAKILDGDSSERLSDIYHGTESLYVVTYLGFMHMVCNTSSKKRKMVPNRNTIKKVSRVLDCVMLDEVHNCKNKDSLYYRVCNSITNDVVYKYGATGTPTGRDRQDLWAQFHLIDKGETLGQTISVFRAAFFKEKEGFGGRTEYQFDPKKEKMLQRFLANRSLSYNEKELGNMPAKQEIVVPIPQSEGVRNYYSMVRKGLVNYYKGKDKANQIQIKNHFIRLRQVVSGFIGLDNQGQKVEATFSCEKTDWLDDALDKLVLSKGKVVVFHDFVQSGKSVQEVLQKKRIPFVAINGSMSRKKKAHSKKLFLEDDSVRVCVVNYKAGGTAWNPHKVATKLIFYELPTSPIAFGQALKRVFRRSQGKNKRTVYIYYLLTKDSVEEKVYEYIKEGRSILKALLDNRRRSIV